MICIQIKDQIACYYTHNSSQYVKVFIKIYNGFTCYCEIKIKITIVHY